MSLRLPARQMSLQVTRTIRLMVISYQWSPYGRGIKNYQMSTIEVLN